MATDELNFSEDLELYVDVSCADLPITKGHLVFRCNQVPCLSIEDYSWPHLLQKKQEIYEKEKTVVKCVYRNDSYYLYLNDISYNNVYPKYVVKSDDEYNYSRFYVSVPGLFVFFSGARGFLLLEGELRKKIEDYFLEVEFEYLQKAYLLNISHDFSITTKNNQSVILEDALLCVQKKEGCISLDEAKSLSLKIYNFFSLIFGVGLSIKYISLGGEYNGRMKYSPFYFANSFVERDEINHPVKTFITHPSNLTKDDWHLMLNNFFAEKNKREFEDIWTRFVSMLSYKGFWEYKILGYASILDIYSQKLMDKEKRFKIPSSKMKILKGKTINFVNEKSESLGISDDSDSREIIESFCDYINAFKNTLSPTFRERYIYALELIDDDFLGVINFTDENFVLLKKIRDSAAHGKPIRFDTEEYDGGVNISSVLILLNKLIIILSCLSFKTLGINEKRFAKMIVHSHNSTKINALLDGMKLDIYCDEAKVVKIDENAFLKTKGLFAFDFIVLENKITGEMEFNNSQLLNLMANFKEEHKDRFQYADFCHYIYNNYSLSTVYCVEVFSKVYFVCNEDVTCLHGVPWITF